MGYSKKNMKKNSKTKEKSINCSKVTSFEKYMLCKYLIDLIDSIVIQRPAFLDFYKKLIDTLNLDLKLCPKFDNKHLIDYKAEVKFKKNLVVILTKHIKSLSVKKNFIAKKIIIISNLYNLNEFETQYFLYYALKEVNSLFWDLEDLYKDEYSPFQTFGIKVLKLKSWNTLQTRKKMFEKGIFIKRGLSEDKIYLNSFIMNIIFDNNVKTQTHIKNILLGKNQKSELKWKDFEYLNKNRDITLNILTSAIKNKSKGINILLYGAVGTGKTQFAKLVANKAKCDMYSVSSETMDKEATRQDRLYDLVSKQNILSKVENSCILFDEAEDVMNRGFTDFGNASKAYLNTLIEETPVPVLWTTNNIYDVDPAFLRRMTYTIEFERLSDDIRLNIWKRTLRKNKLKIDNKTLIELNKSYNISPSLIANAVNTTKLINGTKDDFEIFIENLARVVTKKKNLKKKKEFEMKEYNENLINTDLDIKDLTSKIKSCAKLNFSLCLYGEPGTGKSLYARYLANELGLDVILKRASDLMSKYVGETEQNIAEAFAEAKAKKAMLIFDEADSFLQNRNNAIRNWEIAQVNEMLTWMESHEYPFVCTTNLLDTLDEASLRRFTFKIKFDFMTKKQVNKAFEYFFGIKNANVNIKGLTAGDFATVKKKADFLCIEELPELCKMLEDEVKVKKSKELQNNIGF